MSDAYIQKKLSWKIYLNIANLLMFEYQLSTLFQSQKAPIQFCLDLSCLSLKQLVESNIKTFSSWPPGIYTFLKNRTEIVFWVLVCSCMKCTFLQRVFPSKISLWPSDQGSFLICTIQDHPFTSASAFLLIKNSDFPKYFQINFASFTAIWGTKQFVLVPFEHTGTWGCFALELQLNEVNRE